MPPILWYLSTKLSGVTSGNSLTLIFTAVVTLKYPVVLPCFSFSLNLTQPVYTQHSHKQTSTECYCRLWRVWDIQQKVNTSRQLVSQTWCSLKVVPQRKVCQVCCVIFCGDTSFALVRHRLCTTFQMQLVCTASTPSTNYCRQTHTHASVTYFVCL